MCFLLRAVFVRSILSGWMSAKRPSSSIDSFSRKKSQRGRRDSSQSDDSSLFLQCPVCGANVRIVYGDEGQILKSLIEQHVEDCLAAQQSEIHIAPVSQASNESAIPSHSAPSQVAALSEGTVSTAKKEGGEGEREGGEKEKEKMEEKSFVVDQRPLAERMRPRTFDELCVSIVTFSKG